MLNEKEERVLIYYAKGKKLEKKQDYPILKRLCSVGFVKMGYSKEGNEIVPTAKATDFGKSIVAKATGDYCLRDKVFTFLANLAGF